MVRIGEVVEGGEVDAEDADGGDGDGDGGRDPMHACEARPAEHEEADGHEGALDAREVQPALGRGGEFPVALGDALLVDGYDGCEYGADAHGGEDSVGLLEGEAVVALEDERDGGEGEVQDGPGEGDPEGEEEDDGLGEEEAEGAEEGDADEGEEGAALFVFEGFPADAVGSGGEFVVRCAGGKEESGVPQGFAGVVVLV